MNQSGYWSFAGSAHSNTITVQLDLFIGGEKHGKFWSKTLCWFAVVGPFFWLCSPTTWARSDS